MQAGRRRSARRRRLALAAAVAQRIAAAVRIMKRARRAHWRHLPLHHARARLRRPAKPCSASRSWPCSAASPVLLALFNNALFGTATQLRGADAVWCSSASLSLWKPLHSTCTSTLRARPRVSSASPAVAALQQGVAGASAARAHHLRAVTGLWPARAPVERCAGAERATVAQRVRRQPRRGPRPRSCCGPAASVHPQETTYAAARRSPSADRLCRLGKMRTPP